MLPIRVFRLPGPERRDDLVDRSTRARHSWPASRVSESDVAYIHHTSGTSTGLPKPIPQSHRAAAGVLPCLEPAFNDATYTTTPLYHGGIADCLRAWKGGAMIWLFPGKELPITAQNILKSIKSAQRPKTWHGTPPIRYFSSVPYVLQMLAADEEGLEMLKSMKIVGVGGAALPQDVGDDLVEKHVNLISRFGSAECGFLMSSHRDYATDKEWQYLRNEGSTALSFEPREDGLAELVILPQWPHMAKRNRDDGSFATADLFEAHPTIPNAWKYHSRADSQLTFRTGKKFDPAPLEASIATSPMVSDILVFGNDRHYPGALLFRSPHSVEMPEEQLLEGIWPLIEKLNAESQDHARLSRSMLVVMSRHAPGLEKSSKGTILRGLAEDNFRVEINKAYDGAFDTDTNGQESGLASTIPDHDIPRTVSMIVEAIVKTKDPIPEDADLFSYGVDSIACIRIRAILKSVSDVQGNPSSSTKLLILIRKFFHPICLNFHSTSSTTAVPLKGSFRCSKMPQNEAN